MAYLLPLRIKCDDVECKKWAKVMLKDWRHEHRGYWCRWHGHKKLRERKERELRINQEPVHPVFLGDL